MSKYSQKIFWITVSFLFAGFLWASIEQVRKGENRLKAIENEKVAATRLKEGTIDTYDEGGTLKTRVNYEKGYKHGISYLFYENGQVQLAMPYQYGKRNGISRKYYDSGKLYAETPYRNDKLTGSRVLFYRNGNKKAELPYFNSWPGVGLIEYTQNAELKDLDGTVLTVITNSDLKLIAPDACVRDVAFYITDLFEDQFLDVHNADLIRLATEGPVAVINLEKYTPGYLKMRDVVCKCKTSMGNEWVNEVMDIF